MSVLTSKTISAIRFPMIIAVVLLHTYIIDRPINGIVYIQTGTYTYLDYFIQIYQNELANFSVHLFFFISGFLFFIGLEKFEWKKYFHKCHKRFYSLVIPFFIWNIIFMLFVAAVNALAPSLLSYKKSFLNMSFFEICNCFWEMSQGLIPLWFLRDLIIITIICPIIYFLLSCKLNKVVMLFFTLFYLSGYCQYVEGIGLRALYPFILGAWFSINKIDPIIKLRKHYILISILTLLLVSIDFFMWKYNKENLTIVSLMRLIGGIWCLISVSYLVERYNFGKFKLFSESSFFVFVFHMFIIYIPAKLWIKILPINALGAFISILIIPFMVSFSCVGIYFLLKLIMPKFTAILVGNR
ncbi:acyltransferase family protein [Prevotella amnii]|uniref:acyltransferase family protein n=1 Tax=Prevotella amnii TaxID=419005 RepID=UPI00336AD785